MLRDCAKKIEGGQRDYQALEAAADAALVAAGLRTDYVHICSRSTLLPATAADRELVVLAAAWAGTTRLIDNIQVESP